MAPLDTPAVEATSDNAIKSVEAKSVEAEPINFIDEDALSQALSADHWANMPCGHDCCTCDRECK